MKSYMHQIETWAEAYNREASTMSIEECETLYDDAFFEAMDLERSSLDFDKRKVSCEVYSRVVGYLRPVNNWNLGKKQEFKDRVNYRFSEVRDAGTTVQDQHGAMATAG